MAQYEQPKINRDQTMEYKRHKPHLVLGLVRQTRRLGHVNRFCRSAEPRAEPIRALAVVVDKLLQVLDAGDASRSGERCMCQWQWLWCVVMIAGCFAVVIVMTTHSRPGRDRGQ